MSDYVIMNDEGPGNHPRYFYIVKAMVEPYNGTVDIKWSWDIEEARKYTHEKAEHAIKVMEYCMPSIKGQLTIEEVGSTHEDYDRAMSIV